MALVNDEVHGSEMRHNKPPVADDEALRGTKFLRAPLPLLPLPPLKLLTKLHPELEIIETLRPGPGLQPNVLTRGSKL